MENFEGVKGYSAILICILLDTNDWSMRNVYRFHADPVCEVENSTML